jgi:cytochrome P450
MSVENLQHTASFELHKLRRQAMGRFFSSKEVLKLESLIKESVEKLCLRLEQGRESGEPVDVGLLYRSLTADMCVSLTSYFLSIVYSS